MKEEEFKKYQRILIFTNKEKDKGNSVESMSTTYGEALVVRDSYGNIINRVITEDLPEVDYV